MRGKQIPRCVPQSRGGKEKAPNSVRDDAGLSRSAKRGTLPWRGLPRARSEIAATTATTESGREAGARKGKDARAAPRAGRYKFKSSYDGGRRKLPMRGFGASVFDAVTEQARFGQLLAVDHAGWDEDVGYFGRVRDGYVNRFLRFIAAFAAETHSHRRDVLTDTQLIVGIGLANAGGEPSLHAQALASPLIATSRNFRGSLRATAASGAWGEVFFA